MFAGHVGAALVIGRAERRVNVGVFIAAALLLDLLLWLFIAHWISILNRCFGQRFGIRDTKSKKKGGSPRGPADSI